MKYIKTRRMVKSLDKNEFDSNLREYSHILMNNSAELKNFAFHSVMYVEGIRQDISIIEKYCEKGWEILDLGCGSGHVALQLASRFFVKGIDVTTNNPEMNEVNDLFKSRNGLQQKIWKDLETLNVNIKFNFYDGKKIPFDSNSFDAVVAYAVIEHIPSCILDQIIAEVSRVLKTNGYFFVYRTPRKLAIAEHTASLFRLGHHKSLLNEEEVVSMLKKHGFSVLKVERTDMIISFIPIRVLQHLWNFLSPILFVLDRLALRTPLSIFAHHMRIIARKQVHEPNQHA
jgi:ubiquinone/menaquinone biosynthesis C-methylase UbiE